MEIQYAKEYDLEAISGCDEHISKEELLKSILDNRVVVVKDGDKLCGWFRYNLFWDNTPFLNMIFLLDEYRHKGLGYRLMIFWEKEMEKKNYNLLMTSSLSNEDAQHFYRKLGYKDSGCLLLKSEPLEILFTKEI
ncbi:MAG: GNAT family N-acetyltransferase [Bacteroides sp.]|nr:GNAT family N-acetyltransferase [Bacteroides sp.]